MFRSFIHRCATWKRRGDCLPARFRVSAPASRQGVTLVELMIAMLILAIVCLSWFEILAIQSAKREGLRREGVERLAGMMEAFAGSLHDVGDPTKTRITNLASVGNLANGGSVVFNLEAFNNYLDNKFIYCTPNSTGSKVIHPIFTESEIREGGVGAVSPGYRLSIATLGNKDAPMNAAVVNQFGSQKSLFRSGSPILVGDLYERDGEVGTSDEPKRICRLMLFVGTR